MGMREDYMAKLKEQLTEWGAQIEILEIRAEQLDIEMRLKCHQQLDELRAKRDEALNQVHALQDATEEAWDEVRKGGESVLNTIRTTFHEAKSKFEKK